MKGLVFTEFADLVERRFGLELLDRVIETAAPGSRGAWTSVGTYDAGELLAMVAELSRLTGIAPPTLVCSFGEYLIERFADRYAEFFAPHRDVVDFLRRVDNYVHVEVLKLYPGAQLPKFKYESEEPNKLVMTYRSERPLADLAEGLIRGAIAHFGEPAELTREDLDPPGRHARFTIVRKRV